MSLIHPTALVDPDAHLAPSVSVGPFAVIGPQVDVADGCIISAHVILERNVRLGRECFVGSGSIIGGDPQDLKYDGEETWVEIGPETRIRELVTVNRGTAASGVTRIDRHCYLMTYVHVAHDCRLGEHVTLSNAVQLGGHVAVEAHASIGGSSAVHQFARVGAHAFVGGGSRVPQDIPPFVKAAGNPVKLYGLNSVGLERAGFSESQREALRKAYRLLFNSKLTREEALSQLKVDFAFSQEVQHLVEFVEQSDRGVLAGIA